MPVNMISRHGIGDALLPVARAWIRYAPGTVLKYFLWRRFSWRPREFRVRTVFGARMRGCTQDLIQRYIYYFGTWEPNLTAWLAAALGPGDVFVDVGANIGYYSLLAAPRVGATGAVVAVEASPLIFEKLVESIEANRLANVRTACVAATSVPGTLRIYHGDRTNLGSSTVIPDRVTAADGGLEVQGAPLRAILTVDELRRARVIKIDVEGAELDVLKGLALERGGYRPDLAIVAEVAPGDEAAVVCDLMARCGFHPYILANDYRPDPYLERRPVTRPVRLAGQPVHRYDDMVFSQLDAAWL